MITNKDISIDSENGKIILNGDKYDLGTQGEIDTAVKGVYSVMGQNGAKNLIPYPYNDTTKTIGTLTFTDNGDGSITVNGTATQNSTFYFTPSTWNNEEIKGNVILSSGGAALNSNFKITIETPSGTNKNLENNGELSLTIAAAIKNIRLFVANGTTVDNVTVKPMLRLASDTDNTYEPYAMTNKQLTEQVADISGQLGNLKFAVLEQTFSDVDATTAWGSLYESASQSFNISSLGLTDPPRAVILSVKDMSYGIIIKQAQSTATAVNFTIMRPSSTTGVSANIDCLVIY